MTPRRACRKALPVFQRRQIPSPMTVRQAQPRTHYVALVVMNHPGHLPL